MKLKWMTLGATTLICGGLACIDEKDTDRMLQPQAEQEQMIEHAPVESLAAEQPNIPDRVDRRVQALERQIEELQKRIDSNEGLQSRFGAEVDQLATQIADARSKIDSTIETEGAVDLNMKGQLDEAVAEIEQKLDELASQIGA